MENSNSTNIQQKLCLATVSNKEYWPGTFVMLKSFLKHNVWFYGEIIIITRETLYLQKKIESIPLKIIFVEPSVQLMEKVQELKKPINFLTNISDRFLKLELFRLIEYDRIIYYDSDILHIKPVDPLLIFNCNLLAALDPSYYRGFVRDRTTLQKVRNEHQSNNTYNNFFNSGFLVISKKFLDYKVYQQLIDALTPMLFNNLADKLADEPVLNKVFENKFEIAPVELNCSVHLLAEGIINSSPIAVHFTGINKPWKILSWFRLRMRSKNYLRYLYHWNKIYFSSIS